MSTSQAGDTHRRPVLDAVLLTVGTLLAIVVAVVLVAQYRPVLFRHDTAFIGLSLAILAGFAALVGFRMGRRAAERDEPRLLRTALLVGAVVVGCATTASVAAVGWYRLRDGVGWPRVELGVLVALVGGFAFAAVLVGAWTQRWWEPLALSLGAGLCLGALIAAAVTSWVLDNDFSDRRADQCIARGAVTYCHYPGYEPFVDDWAPVVDAVLAGAPDEVAQRPLMVQQGTKTEKSYVAGIRPAGAGVVPLLEWSPGNTAPFALAIDTANWVTGRVVVPEQDTNLQIVVDGGGRGVVTYWLAAQATDRTRRGFEHHFYECGEAVSGNDYDAAVLPADSARGDPAGPDRYAAALLKDPDARRKVRENWAELTRPDTTAIEAGLILEIEPEPEQPNRC